MTRIAQGLIALVLVGAMVVLSPPYAVLPDQPQIHQRRQVN